MKVAVVQMVSSQSVDISLARLQQLIGGLSDDVDAVFLPENFAALGNPSPYSIARAEAEDGRILACLTEVARGTTAWVFAGTMPLNHRADGTPVPDERVRAASLVLDPEGRVQHRYDKIHMFDVTVADQHKHYKESDTFEHGDSLCVCDLLEARIGLSVCYDLRFSELYLELAKRGAEIVAAPSAFTVPTGQAHFELLMRARAVEHFLFTVAACQGGTHDSGRETYGHSMVVNPWGEIIAEAGTGEDVLIVDIDLNEVTEAREKMPVLSQRRLTTDLQFR